MEARMISVVIPLCNEQENLKPLFERLEKTLRQYGKSYEVIFVNDGSTDKSEKILEEIQRKNSNVTVINFFRRMGKAIALEQGFALLKGEYVVIMDSDLQYDPEDIPKLLNKMEEGFDIVSGQRTTRHDSKEVIFTSLLFNKLVRWITGLKFNDYFSGIKCFRVNVIQFLALYGDLYRFASVYAFLNGFKVTEIPITHHDRAYGVSKYNPRTRLHRGLLDLAVIIFTITLSRKRAYVLGMIGLLLISIGLTLWTMMFLTQGSTLAVIQNPGGIEGILFLFIGIQLYLVKMVADNFFERHHGEHLQRKHNIKSILRSS